MSIKVEIINKEELSNLYKTHGLFACTCYNTPDKFADRVGKSCSEDGHMSGSRTEYIKFRIYNIDRGTAEQVMRHEIGTDYDPGITYSYQDKIDLVTDVNPCNIVKNMQSFRYVDKEGFSYTIPKAIKNCEEALSLYEDLMYYIDQTRGQIKEALIDNGMTEKQAVENSNYVLPRATELTLTIGFTPEALIHFMHKRLCVRSQDKARELAIAMKDAIKDILPEYAEQLVPHCQYLLWCPEKNRSCGTYPTKERLKDQIASSKSE